jgi:TPR repeat protein
MRVLRLLAALLALLAGPSIAAAQDPAAAAERARTQQEAEAGDLEAAFILGRMYRDGVGGPADKAQARVWLQKAAGGGHVRASVLLALMLMAGEGGAVERDAARPLLLYAGSTGDEDAFYALGVLFAEGAAKTGGGPVQNAPGAVFWFTAASLRGNVDAMYNLGFMYLRGIGTGRSPEQAYGWFLKAAEAGEPQAQFAVATMLAEGQGVPTDPKLALVWYLRAKANGIVDDELEVALTKRLTEAEAEEARRLASAPPASPPAAP